jgi:Leucine-rich repeat (LRR) protein
MAKLRMLTRLHVANNLLLTLPQSLTSLTVLTLLQANGNKYVACRSLLAIKPPPWMSLSAMPR